MLYHPVLGVSGVAVIRISGLETSLVNKIAHKQRKLYQNLDYEK